VVTGIDATIEGAGPLRTITVANPDGQARVSVQAALSGYEPLEQEIQPQPGELNQLTLQLQPEPIDPQITIDLGGGVTMELVLIPAGSFQMGDATGSDNEQPVHAVEITQPFYLGKYEVTQEQWQAVMGGNPSRFKGTKNPVEQVSWNDSQAFLAKLQENSPEDSGAFRLPTEAEWEYACRAGSTTRFCFGDDETNLDAYAWYDSNSGSKTHPVGEKKANAWGLYDMHGNVYEWCHDWYAEDYYANSPTHDPQGPSVGEYRVSRGGCWRFTARFCRSAERDGDDSSFRHSILGFRVARSPSGE
jgi:formylglycine-generating enzyme required for sulfatase activity